MEENANVVPGTVTGSETVPCTDALREKLCAFINENSFENMANVPDYIAADFLAAAFRMFCCAVRARDSWYGVHLCPGNSYFEDQGAPEEEIE